MKLYFPITVDLYNIYPLPIMNIQQHNIGRGALVTLTAAGQLIVPTAEQLYIYAKKKDGTLVYASCTLSGDQIKVDYDEQMAAVPGIMQMELQMVDGRGNSITTPIFQVNVQKTNIDYRGVTSSDEFTALVDALNKVGNIENINKQISDMEENIGTISGLTTTEKGSLVGAINEIDRDVGNLQQLQTQTKTNMVDAVNELSGNFKIGAKNIYDIIDLDDKIEVVESYVKINKSTVDLYARIVVRQVLEDGFLGIVKPEYESAQRYTVFPYYSADAPYNASGSFWVSGVVGNIIRMYNTAINKQYFISARWMRYIV